MQIVERTFLKSKTGSKATEAMRYKMADGTYWLYKEGNQVQLFKMYDSYGFRKRHLAQVEMVLLDTPTGKIFATKDEIVKKNWVYINPQSDEEEAERQLHYKVDDWHKYESYEKAIATLNSGK